VDFPVLEIVGLDPKSGLKMGLSGYALPRINLFAAVGASAPFPLQTPL